MAAETEALIIGASAAGLATAAMLHRAGHPYELVEATDTSALPGAITTDACTCTRRSRCRAFPACMWRLEGLQQVLRSFGRRIRKRRYATVAKEPAQLNLPEAPRCQRGRVRLADGPLPEGDAGDAELVADAWYS
jgi:cation diffusion facilitator CzcD-associated flavoprotein CzcO